MFLYNYFRISNTYNFDLAQKSFVNIHDNLMYQCVCVCKRSTILFFQFNHPIPNPYSSTKTGNT